MVSTLSPSTITLSHSSQDLHDKKEKELNLYIDKPMMESLSMNPGALYFNKSSTS